MALLPASLILLQSTIATAETYEQNFDDFPDGTTELGDGTVLIGHSLRKYSGENEIICQTALQERHCTIVSQNHRHIMVTEIF